MTSALKLRGAGSVPHFHADPSSNGSCGGPPPVRSWPGRWNKPRRRLMSQLHSVLQSVPLGRFVHADCQLPVPSLSPLFCMALRRLNSRAVEAAVSASLPFSLSTSLSSHSAGLETLFSFEQRSLGNVLRRLRVMELYLFRFVLVDSLRPSVCIFEGSLRSTGCRR